MYSTLCFGKALHGRTPFLHGMILSVNISWFVVHIKDSPGEKVSEYDQEIPQSHTADLPMTPRGRTTEYTRGVSYLFEQI